MLPMSFAPLKTSYIEKDLSDTAYNINSLRTNLEAIYSTRRFDRRDCSPNNKRPSTMLVSVTCTDCGKGHSGKCNASQSYKDLYKAKMTTERQNKRIAAKYAKLKSRSCSDEDRPLSSTP